MYDERKEKFTIRDLIIQILFVGLFIFLLMWLFPMKSSVKKSLSPLYDQIFNQNVRTMKEAAITYYTTPRLPKKVGDEEKMTLADMLQQNLILPFVDKNGNQCDLFSSYVSMTKMDEEYILKVNLKCGSQEGYILVHLGCYDYCEGNVCEKQEPEKEQPIINPTPTPTPTPTPGPVTNDKYEYEYIKVTDGKWGEYSNWSEWTKNVITATDYRQVETKIETIDGFENKTVTKLVPVYEEKQVQVGTKQEAYQDTETVTKYRTVPVFEEKRVQVGTKQEAYTETITVTKTRTVPVYTETKVPYTAMETVTKTRIVPVYTETKVPYTTTKVVTEYKTEKVPYEVPVTKTRQVQYCAKKEFQLACTGCKVEEKCVSYAYRDETYTTTETRYKEEKVPYTTTKVVTEYKTEKVQTGTKQETYKETIPVTKYKTEKVQTGTKQEEYQDKETVTKYKEVPVYEMKQVQTGTKQETYTENVTVTKYKEIPVYETKKVQTGVKEVSETVKVLVQSKVTYYRSRTREYISGTIDTKWSMSQSDKNLLAAGYSLTGNSRKI